MLLSNVLRAAREMYLVCPVRLINDTVLSQLNFLWMLQKMNHFAVTTTEWKSCNTNSI